MLGQVHAQKDKTGHDLNTSAAGFMKSRQRITHCKAQRDSSQENNINYDYLRINSITSMLTKQIFLKKKIQREIGKNTSVLKGYNSTC